MWCQLYMQILTSLSNSKSYFLIKHFRFEWNLRHCTLLFTNSTNLSLVRTYKGISQQPWLEEGRSLYETKASRGPFSYKKAQRQFEVLALSILISMDEKCSYVYIREGGLFINMQKVEMYFPRVFLQSFCQPTLAFAALL